MAEIDALKPGSVILIYAEESQAHFRYRRADNYSWWNASKRQEVSHRTMRRLVREYRWALEQTRIND